MYETLSKWIPLLLSTLPFIFFCWINAKNNLKKEFRNRQFLAPVFALIYSIVSMICANKISNMLLSFVRSIPEYVARYSKEIAKMIKDFITDINLTFWIFLVANIVILLVYIIIKKIFLAICNRIIGSDKNASGSDGSIHGRIVSNFYTFQNDKNIWTVKEDFGQARTLLCWFYVGAVLISSIVFLACKDQMADEYIRIPFYPVFGIMLVGELYFFLNGYTNFEFINEVLGEDEENYKVLNYSLLRNVLRKIFPDRIVTENTMVDMESNTILSNDEVVKELLINEDPSLENFGTYIDSLVKEGYDLDHNYITSTVDLLNGKSVLFSNPFYKDLSMYVLYPANRELLKHNKCLVVLGRHGIEEDVKDWIYESMANITTVPSLWKVGMLSKEKTDYDIGIISKSDVLNVKIHEANRDFFEQVSYVVLVEPSKLITTAQIGVNAIAKLCSNDGEKKVIYCSIDKNCDGLVDSLSHILMTDMCEVCATNKNQGTVSYMCWDTNAEYTHHRIFPNISRYLGFGTELSFVALKNQVSEATWFGGEVYPVTDQFWINRQYYYDLLKYAGHPTKQEELSRIFKVSPNLWSAEIKDSEYITVEDENNNLFETLRLFSTRISQQGFVNVISSEYLLKEYMVDNSYIFENDPKAIPRIVADYARTERNIILRLIIMLASKHLCEDYIEKEFSLIGIKAIELKKMLWFEILKCFSSADEELNYDEIEEKRLVQVDEKNIERSFDISIIRSSRKFDLATGQMKDYYYIEDSKFIECNVCRLLCADYIAEDEKGNINYLGSELLDNVFHKHIPGQFLTLNGKYYEYLSLTSNNSVLIRRAADHIDGRHSYRQIRHYKISHEKKSDKIGSCRDYNIFKVSNEFADLNISVPAYLDMTGYDDFETAKTVVVNGVPNRTYKNKQILKIELPSVSQEVKYAITVMINEILTTLFADDQAYLSAVTKMNSEFYDGLFTDDSEKYYSYLKQNYPLTHFLFEEEGCSISDDAIYIIEDSQLDLGLLIAVERNIKRILEIVYDYFDWHLDKLEKSKNPPPVEEPVFPEPIPGTGIPKKKRFIDKIKDFFKKRKDKKKGNDDDKGATPESDAPIENDVAQTDEPQSEEPQVYEPQSEEPAETDVPQRDEVQVAAPQSDEPQSNADPVEDQVATDTPIESADASSDDNFTLNPSFFILKSEKGTSEFKDSDFDNIEFETEDEETITPGDDGVIAVTEEVSDKLRRLPYHEKNYLMFGSKKINEHFTGTIICNTLDYLKKLGFDNSALTQARRNKNIADTIEKTYKPYLQGTHYCDFCGVELSGTEYEILIDGRERCMQCGRSAVKTGEEFAEIFKDVLRNMETFFGIRINVGIKVEMINSKKLAKRLGQTFIPTSNFDARAVGLAVSDGAGYTILIENGAPRVKSMMTIAHELTHIWQYINWDKKQINSLYGKNASLEIYEGMSTWVEIQYAAYINEPAMAKRTEMLNMYRDDEYGRGFVKYLGQYPISYTGDMEIDTPFKNFPPLK